MTHDMSVIMERRRGRRPILSMRNQGMKEATKNHVCRNPDMSAERCELKPREEENSVLL